MGFDLPTIVLIGVVVILAIKQGRQTQSKMMTTSSSQSSLETVVEFTPEQVQRQIQEQVNALKSSGNLKIYNSFIQDEATLIALANSSLWQQCIQNSPFWWDAEEALDRTHTEDITIWQRLVRQIWSNQETVTKEAVGFEFWCNKLTHEIPLGWHYDRDERSFETNGRIATPIMGAVYYGYPHNFRGGYLEMIPADFTTTADEIGNYLLERERVRPEYNRMVMLNVSKWHSVSEITSSGERYTFAVNAWQEKPMSD